MSEGAVSALQKPQAEEDRPVWDQTPSCPLPSVAVPYKAKVPCTEHSSLNQEPCPVHPQLLFTVPCSPTSGQGCALASRMGSGLQREADDSSFKISSAWQGWGTKDSRDLVLLVEENIATDLMMDYLGALV